MQPVSWKSGSGGRHEYLVNVKDLLLAVLRLLDIIWCQIQTPFKNCPIFTFLV